MATVDSYRRYCLLKRRTYDVIGPPLDGLARVWQAKQEAIASEELPADFPSLAELTAAGYSTVDDLQGADEDELVGLGLNFDEAQSVLTALAAL